MPLYEYRCSVCGAKKEHLETISAATIRPCDACGKPAERVISASSFTIPGFKNGQAL